MFFHILPILFISTVIVAVKDTENDKKTRQSNKQPSIGISQYTTSQDERSLALLIMAAQQISGPPKTTEKPEPEPIPQSRYALRVRKTKESQNTEIVAANRNRNMHTNMDDMTDEHSQDIREASEEESDIDDSLGTGAFLMC